MPGQMPSSIHAACLGRGGSGEQLKTIIQLWPLNRGIKTEKCPVPPTKQSMATLSFYNEQGRTQVINRQNDAELLPLFMQQNCLEQHLVLWRFTIQWHLLTQSMLQQEGISAFI